ncbi:zinc-binding dehydrogenase [Micromonospora okii]|uniref:Enoyl reductase n=1 Tax=Micromonospora okii TaxID=1182970 RepID=A0A023GUI5_9ACTN|nr:zinc-binding dehydrogenase [Micromonospora okii]AFJ52692.1 enoyl reductase [Micromonospora okii]
MGLDTERTAPPGTTSRRVVMTTLGEPEALRVRTGARPAARRGRVVVRVEAAGVSFAEVQTLRGLHPFPPKPPCVLGYDLVGRIVEVGPGVTGWRTGDRVVSMPRVGAWQEYAEVSAKSLAGVPEDLDAGEAVALVCNGVTAWQMLHRSARVRPGATVLVHGASGGVGTLLTQLAVRHGVRVIGTASPAKHDAVRALGAEPLDYRDDVVAAVRKLAPRGVDAVFDHIGGAGLNAGWSLLAPGGTLVSYDSSVAGYRPGQWFRPHLPALRKVIGWNVAGLVGAARGRRARTYYVKPGPHFRDDLASLFTLVRDGVLRPTVARRYPLDEAGRAVRELIDGGVIGKLVLVP